MSDPAANANITPIAIEQEMRSSFMDYAMSVIVARALPDVPIFGFYAGGEIAPLVGGQRVRIGAVVYELGVE